MLIESILCSIALPNDGFKSIIEQVPALRLALCVLLILTAGLTDR